MTAFTVGFVAGWCVTAGCLLGWGLFRAIAWRVNRDG